MKFLFKVLSSNFMNFFANNFFQMILTMIFTLIVVAYYSWEVAILLFTSYSLFLWLTAITSREWQAKTKGIYAGLLYWQMGITEAAQQKLKAFDLVAEE